MRISNFLIWQAAYSEWYFTPTLWPDFDKAEFHRAIQEFCTATGALAAFLARGNKATNAA